MAVCLPSTLLPIYTLCLDSFRVFLLMIKIKHLELKKQFPRIKSLSFQELVSPVSIKIYFEMKRVDCFFSHCISHSWYNNPNLSWGKSPLTKAAEVWEVWPSCRGISDVLCSLRVRKLLQWTRKNQFWSKGTHLLVPVLSLGCCSVEKS